MEPPATKPLSSEGKQGIALSLAVSSGDPRRERIGITEAARSLELNDKAHDPIAKLENVLFCR